MKSVCVLLLVYVFFSFCEKNLHAQISADRPSVTVTQALDFSPLEALDHMYCSESKRTLLFDRNSDLRKDGRKIEVWSLTEKKRIDSFRLPKRFATESKLLSPDGNIMALEGYFLGSSFDEQQIGMPQFPDRKVILIFDLQRHRVLSEIDIDQQYLDQWRFVNSSTQLAIKTLDRTQPSILPRGAATGLYSITHDGVGSNIEWDSRFNEFPLEMFEGNYHEDSAPKKSFFARRDSQGAILWKIEGRIFPGQYAVTASKKFVIATTMSGNGIKIWSYDTGEERFVLPMSGSMQYDPIGDQIFFLANGVISKLLAIRLSN